MQILREAVESAKHVMTKANLDKQLMGKKTNFMHVTQNHFLRKCAQLLDLMNTNL